MPTNHRYQNTQTGSQEGESLLATKRSPKPHKTKDEKHMKTNYPTRQYIPNTKT